MMNFADLRDRSPGTDFTRTLTVLVAWFFVALWLSVRGALGANGAPPIGLGLALAAPLLAFAIDGRFGHPLLGGLTRLPITTLIALQTFRVLGVVFVIAWMGDKLPAGFALLAGLGDMTVGLTAPFVAAAVANRRPYRVALLAAWNVFGVIDLVVAVVSGVTHSSSSFGILAGSVTTDALARYPFSVIPTFFVPLALLLHLLTFRAMVRPAPMTAHETRTGEHRARAREGSRLRHDDPHRRAVTNDLRR